jgi:hypothetical protein
LLIQFLLIHTIRANIAQPVAREMIAATAPPSPQPPQLPPEVEFSCRELAKKSAHTAADLRKVAHRRLKSLREYFNISSDNPPPPCVVRACNVLLQDYINRATITVTTRTLLADESNPDSEYIIMQRDTPNKGEKFLLRGAARNAPRGRPSVTSSCTCPLRRSCSRQTRRSCCRRSKPRSNRRCHHRRQRNLRKHQAGLARSQP